MFKHTAAALVAVLLFCAFALSSPAAHACGSVSTCQTPAYLTCVTAMNNQQRAETGLCYSNYQSCTASCNRDQTLSPGEKIQCNGFCNDDWSECKSLAWTDYCWNLVDCEETYCYYQSSSAALSSAASPFAHKFSVSTDAINKVILDIEKQKARNAAKK